MKRLALSLFLVFLFPSLSHGKEDFRLGIQMIDRDTVQVTIINESTKKRKVKTLSETARWNYEIWIESKEGDMITSSDGICSKGNWYLDPPTISSFKKVKSRKYPVLRPGESFSQTFRLSFALSYLSVVPPNVENGFKDRISVSNGPFMLKIRWAEIESNWVELDSVLLE